MGKHIFAEIDEGVLRIEIRRPEKKNAITAAMYQDLADALKHAEENPAVRVILLHGQPHVFTSGNDVLDFLNNPPSSESDPVFQFLRHLIHAGKLIIVAVAGAAVGIGTTLLLHCDYVMAGKSAEFSTPFVNLGLCPEAGSSLMLPLVTGYRRAAELLLFGESIGAYQALDWGLVNCVVPDEELAARALAKARALATKPATALRMSKSLLKKKVTPLAAQAMLDEAYVFGDLLTSADAREGLSAFVEKRAPNFA